MSVPGVAWACETCWRLFTAQSTITRTDRVHGDGCQGKTARRLVIDSNGWPVPGQLSPGEAVAGPCFVRGRSSAAIAGPAVSAPAAAAAPPPPPPRAPAPAVPAGSAPAPDPRSGPVWYPPGYDILYPPPPPPSSPRPPSPPSSPRVLVHYGECIKPSNVLAWRRDRDKRDTKTPPPGRDKVMS